MSEFNFPLMVKSTLDYVVNQIVQASAVADLAYSDFDMGALEAELLASDTPLLGWSLGAMGQDPRDPLWSLEVAVGSKVSADPAQYMSFDLLAQVLSVFSKNARIEVKDYTQVSAPTTVLGVIHIADARLTPTDIDRTSSVRLVHITARAQRFVNG